MTLKAEDKEYLADVGFTDSEIVAFDIALDPAGKPQPPIDLADGTWIAAIKDRSDWIQRIQDAEPSIDLGEIKDLIDQFYGADPRANPWDFIKASYVPKKKKLAADFVEAATKAQEEAKERVRRFYGR